jgi:hypothetical protein
MLRIQKLPDHTPVSHTVHGWKVENISSEIDRLSSAGVAFSFFPRLTQSEREIWISPSGDKVALFKDPAGNYLSLTEFSAS